jgi:hypothetical protein
MRKASVRTVVVGALAVHRRYGILRPPRKSCPMLWKDKLRRLGESDGR